MSRFLARPYAGCWLRQAPSAARRCYSAPASAFDWQDPLASKSLLTDEEKAIEETAERYCQEKLAPRVLGVCRSVLKCFFLPI